MNYGLDDQSAEAGDVARPGTLYELWETPGQSVEAVCGVSGDWDGAVGAACVATDRPLLGDTIWDCETCWVICWI